MLQIGDHPIHEAVTDVVVAIRVARESNGVSMYRLAKLTGLHPSTISLIERGERNPSLFVILKMAEALGVSLGGILSKCEPHLAQSGPGAELDYEPPYEAQSAPKIARDHGEEFVARSAEPLGDLNDP
jgi:transcriptional regulator with XRE-family HTH domain